MRTMAKLATILTVAAITVLGCARSFTQDAEAATFTQWKFRGKVVCVETHGWQRWPALEAARAWRQNGELWITAGPDCSYYPKEQRVILRVYSDDSDRACAKTDPGLLYASDHSPGGPVTIWLNMSPKWWNQCHATTAQRAHVITHEIGHAAGLGHPDAEVDSVMQDWDVQRPTERDLTQLRVRYQ